MGQTLPLKGRPPTTCTGALPTFIYDMIYYIIYDILYMTYHIHFAECFINGAGCKGDLADSEIQVVVELCRNRYKMHLQEFMLNINPKTHRLMSMLFRVFLPVQCQS